MSRPALVLLACALACVTAGCSDEASSSASEESTAALTAAELGWLREYSAWTIDVHEGELGPSPGRRLVEVCRDRLDDIGEPPSARFEDAAERAAEACPLLVHRGMHRQALDVIEDADDLIVPLLLEVQSLPSESGPTDTSRVDVDLSAWMTRDLERPAEARCWDEDDWVRVVREDDAWSDDSTDPEDLYGWADSSVDRIYMRLDQCNLIAEFRNGEPAGGRAHEIELADALGTLFHETEHLFDPDADEAEAECGMLSFYSLHAAELGGDYSRAERLERLYRAEVYPEQPDEYIMDCDE